MHISSNYSHLLSYYSNHLDLHLRCNDACNLIEFTIRIQLIPLIVAYTVRSSVCCTRRCRNVSGDTAIGLIQTNIRTFKNVHNIHSAN